MITHSTKREVFNILRHYNVSWSGRQTHTQFLNSLYKLSELPSYDPRYQDAESDIWQHTENNDDWEEYWIIEDKRLSLIEGDCSYFLNFIQQVLNPFIRDTNLNPKKIISTINDYLKSEGWVFYEENPVIDLSKIRYKESSEATIPSYYSNVIFSPRQGGMAELFFAVDERVNTPVAIKIFKEDGTIEDKQRFRREVRLLEKYSGSGYVIPILEKSLESDRPFFVMPRAAYDLLDLSKDLTIKQYETIIFRAIDCLDFLHSNKDLHRDIKPSNFLVLDNVIVMADFGLAKDPTSETQFTNTIFAAGTEGYSPPEFFDNIGTFKNPEPKDDIYSLAKTFYYIFTRKAPIVLKEDSKIPRPILEVLRSATNQMNREERYGDCQEFRVDIKEAFDLVFDRNMSDYDITNLTQRLGSLGIEELKLVFEYLGKLDIVAKEKFFNTNSFNLILDVIKSTESATYAKNVIETYNDIQSYIMMQSFWPFSYAEKVARDMALLFDALVIKPEDKANALRLAYDFADNMNRVAAFNICERIVESIEDDDLAFSCIPILKKYEDRVFQEGIQLERCKNLSIAKVIFNKREATKKNN